MTSSASSPQILSDLGAAELAQRLQRRELTAEALMHACLERIDEREPEVRAWTSLAADAALARARELDQGAVQGPLHGLPLGVKDLFDTADLPTGYGSAIYDGFRPVWDAAAVAIAREAGAIVLGKTVTTEFATFTPGKTRNPHHAGHTPGGSSSGSAAAVAAGMVPLAFGTQTAGSVVRPAAFCGIVGYKPGMGSVARAGVKALSETLDTIGFFGRGVDDVALFASAVMGDARLRDLDTGAAPRIAICRTFQWEQAGADTQAALAHAVNVLSRAGAHVSELALPPDFAPLLQVQSEIQDYEQARNLSYERLRHAAALSARLQEMLARGMAISAEAHWRNLALAASARARADALFDEYDVLLAPSTIGEAPAGLDATGDPVFCRVWTLLGLPCVHLPFATGQGGLPVGLQAVGRFGAERSTLAAAKWMHQRL